jgi:hypothetical protein
VKATHPSLKVKNRVEHWKKLHDREAGMVEQLEWAAEVVEYVNFVHGQTKVHGNKKNAPMRSLLKEIPLFGPRFIPPSYLHIQKREPAPIFRPGLAYLKPISVIHPFYYPQLTGCPQCRSSEILWEGWTSTGPRDVHGIKEEELALGVQLRCKICESVAANDVRRTYCFATTNPNFWTHLEHWKMPRKWEFEEIKSGNSCTVAGDVPHFLTRCAVTRELFDLIIEIRPTTTSTGLAENIQRKR